VCRAYTDLGIRAFVGPLLRTLLPLSPAHSLSLSLTHSLTHCAGLLVDLEALDTIAKEPIREPSSIPPAQPHQAVPIAGATAHALDVLERAAKQFHRPESGVWIVAGASGLHSSSDELIIGCRDISNKYNLPRHLHVLETRNQQQVAWDKYGESAGTTTAPCLRRIASRRARKSLTLLRARCSGASCSLGLPRPQDLVRSRHPLDR